LVDLINEAKLPNAVPYAVSKAALSTLFAKLDAAYEGEGLLFISLDPSWIDNGVDPATCKEYLVCYLLVNEANLALQ
jgi:NAD(P)-dependent dehydrogenase (short-subunit alcohol dehydrogenase family)